MGWGRGGVGEATGEEAGEGEVVDCTATEAEARDLGGAGVTKGLVGAGGAEDAGNAASAALDGSTQHRYNFSPFVQGRGVTLVHLGALGCPWVPLGALECTWVRLGALGCILMHLGCSVVVL